MPETKKETETTQPRSCIYCGTDYEERDSNAVDKQSYCTADHEAYDDMLATEEDEADDFNEDEDEDDEEEISL